jgi:hypothetical protein
MRIERERKMTYGIELHHEESLPEYVQLTAKTDTGAVRQLKKWLSENTALDPETLVCLSFSRSSDGCTGYINPGGNASTTGKSWKANA